MNAMYSHDDLYLTRGSDTPPMSKTEAAAHREPEEWFACEQPERPPDVNTSWHDCCTKCMLAVTAAELNGESLLSVYDSRSMLNVMCERLEKFGEAPE